MSDDTDTKSREVQIARGFNPDVESFTYYGCFTFDEAKRSLFESTRSAPIPVIVRTDREGHVRIPVVIDLMQASYISTGEEDYPDWIFEGWVIPNFYLPLPKIRRVRIHVATLGQNEFSDDDFFTWQWVPDPETVSS